MTTTPELLEAMERADRLRAQRASSSMHPGWLDDEELGRVTLAYYLTNSYPFPRHWLDDHRVTQELRNSVEMLERGEEPRLDLMRLPAHMQSAIPEALLKSKYPE
jgi:hypothetical protein